MSDLRERRLSEEPRGTPGERLLEALDLMALGMDLRRAGERARHPDATDDEIERRVMAWLHAPEPPEIDLRPRGWPRGRSLAGRPSE